MPITRTRCLSAILLFLVLAVAAKAYLSEHHPDVIRRLKGQKTLSEVLEEVGPSARARLVTNFSRSGVSYPPKEIVLAVFKDTRVLELYADGKKVHRYQIQRASGMLGPKLKEGDGQVPEGIYKITSLNPNSSFHLSMRLNYPNGFDLAKAKADRRDQLGSDIMIHGKTVSIGCLAMGDEVIEELFILAADVGIDNAQVILCPTDLRQNPEPTLNNLRWGQELYSILREALTALPG